MMGAASVHANFGYTFSGDASEEAAANFVPAPLDVLNYGVATDVVLHPRVTTSFEVVGRRLSDVERVVSRPLNVRFTTLTTPTVVETRSLPGLGIRQSDMNLMLGAAGVRINLVRTLLLSPGIAVAGSEAPACTVRIAASDFWALSRGEKHPFELLMDGKIRLQGRMEVAMALSSVLVG